MRCLGVLLCLLMLVVASCADVGGPSDDGGSTTIAVPGVSDDLGEDAVTSIEDAGLVASTELEDGTERGDPAGCTVLEQDPEADAEAQPEDEVTVTLDCGQVDWENQQGEAWDSFVSGYEDGFEQGCEALFELSP